MKHLEQL